LIPKSAQQPPQSIRMAVDIADNVVIVRRQNFACASIRRRGYRGPPTSSIDSQIEAYGTSQKVNDQCLSIID
jgi:hypothetical protein